MWPFGKRKKDRKACEFAATAHVCDDPLRAHSVREEYIYLATRLCKCGGPLETFDHALRYYRGQPRDVIQTKCTRCAAVCWFVFDISFFFGKDPEEIDAHAHSAILDVMDWAHYGYTCLHRASSSVPARQDHLLQDAIWAFEETLKFYPANGRYPFPHAFFNHHALGYSQLRDRYIRDLPEEAVNVANARLRE